MPFMANISIARKMEDAFVRDLCLPYQVLPHILSCPQRQISFLTFFFPLFHGSLFCTLHLSWPLLPHTSSNLSLLEKDLLGSISVLLSWINEHRNISSKIQDTGKFNIKMFMKNWNLYRQKKNSNKNIVKEYNNYLMKIQLKSAF